MNTFATSATKPITWQQLSGFRHGDMVEMTYRNSKSEPEENWLKWDWMSHGCRWQTVCHKLQIYWDFQSIFQNSLQSLQRTLSETQGGGKNVHVSMCSETLQQNAAVQQYKWKETKTFFRSTDKGVNHCFSRVRDTANITCLHFRHAQYKQAHTTLFTHSVNIFLLKIHFNLCLKLYNFTFYY